MLAISIFSGFMLSVINTAVAITVIKKAIKKDNKTFNKLIFGSMVVRYFFIGFLVWFNLQILKLDALGFSLTFLSTTFVLIIMEILYLNKQSKFINLKNHKDKVR